ncbi:hypothetical protein [Bradyrhizobium cosmicum]|uniref:hypothetical protein n=1 Tax=Bradyrhizobium cosmicum TaxID=1404864 RepID=UPI0028ECA9ED|nr:hypothetical protein [Bradyrhizobium cosmicum]
MMIDCAALVTRLPSRSLIRDISAMRRATSDERRTRSTSASGLFTKAEIACEDVLQSSEMIGHGSAGQKLKCRIPPASNVKKKQEFA